jgi:hypothetical protein
MPSCSNCRKWLDGKHEICPDCGCPTRGDSPGLFGASHKGFLLAFLGIFVLACIIVLAPIFKSAKDVTKKTQAISHAKQIAMAVDIYAADFEDAYPPFKSSDEIALKIGKYVNDEEVKNEVLTYTWNTDLSGMQTVAIRDLAVVWLLYTPVIQDEGLVVAFADAYCKFVPEADLEAIKAKSSGELAASKRE